jgi:hypothetical protein
MARLTRLYREAGKSFPQQYARTLPADELFRGGVSGEAAHLGGAVMGWLLIRNVQWLNIFGRDGRRHALR